MNLFNTGYQCWECLICNKKGNGPFPFKEHELCQLIAQELKALDSEFEIRRDAILAKLEIDQKTPG